MTQFFARKLNKKGFTLAELLIVVAIIAVLVAIALPIFTGALEKARLGVHRSNARSLKSQGVALILGDSNFDSASTSNTGTASKWVVAASYNFDTEMYDNYVVKPVAEFKANAEAGEYYMTTLEDAVDASGSLKTNKNNILSRGWGKFGDEGADKAIGKTKTAGTVYYLAVITEQDLKNAKVTLTNTEPNKH